MRSVIRAIVFGIFSLSLLVTTPVPEIAKAADTWQSASNNGFGNSSNINANKLLNFGDMMLSSATTSVYWTRNQSFGDSDHSVQGATDSTSLVEFIDGFGQRNVYAASKTSSGVWRWMYSEGGSTEPQYWDNTNLPNPPCGVPNGSNTGIGDIKVFGDYIYVGTINPVCGAQIWRSHKNNSVPTWENVLINGGVDRKYYAVQHFFVFQDELTVSFLNSGGVSSCRLAKSSSGNSGTWSQYQATGLYPSGTKCIQTSTELFGMLWIGTESNLYPYNSTLHSSNDGQNFSDPPPGCTLNANGNNCAGGPYLGTVTKLTTLLDRQLVIGNGNGGVLRVCPAYFNGNYIFYYRSLEDQAGMKTNDITVRDDYLYVAQGRRNPNDTTAAKVLRSSSKVNDLVRFFRSGAELCGPKIPANVEIELPSASVFTPKDIRFGADTYTFSISEPCFKIANNCHSKFEVTRVGNGSIDQRYKIKIINIERDTAAINLDDPQNPQGVAWGGRLTLKEPVPTSTISTMANLIRSSYPGQNLNTTHTFLGGDNCEIVTDPFEATKLCFNTTYTMTNNLERPNQPLIEHLFQSIGAPVSGITVEGNVTAPNDVNGFTLDPNAIAVGGNVNVAGSTSQLQRYLNDQSVTFKWNHVSLRLGELYTKGTSLGTRASSGNYNEPNWYLNSTTSNPAVNTTSTFSSPPEGKIWKVDGDLNLRETTFHGSGTVVIDGDLTISDPLSCDSASTRLGFIVHGKISINTDSVSCGAYTALGGNINFKNVASGEVNGIFVARDSIKLPSRASLTGHFSVGYDSYFAANPTALYQELLAVIFSTSS
ncbi:MAG: hypothetical protein AAB613_01220 [Patescibacteria group bacterium]